MVVKGHPDFPTLIVRLPMADDHYRTVSSLLFAFYLLNLQNLLYRVQIQIVDQPI